VVFPNALVELPLDVSVLNSRGEPFEKCPLPLQHVTLGPSHQHFALRLAIKYSEQHLYFVKVIAVPEQQSHLPASVDPLT
jgi:hypothetical protein